MDLKYIFEVIATFLMIKRGLGKEREESKVIPSFI